MQRITHVEGGPPIKAPLSNAVRSGNLVFVSGVTPFDGDMKLAIGDFDAQFDQTIQTLKATLEAAGSSLESIVKCNVLLARRQDWPRMNELYAALWPTGEYPARTAIEAVLPFADFLIEIECVAEVDEA